MLTSSKLLEIVQTVKRLKPKNEEDVLEILKVHFGELVVKELVVMTIAGLLETLTLVDLLLILKELKDDHYTTGHA